MSQWSASFQQGKATVEDLKKKCMEILGSDEIETRGRGSFISLNIRGNNNKGRAYLEEVLIPYGLVSLIPLDLKADEGGPVGGSPRGKEPSPELMVKIKDMLLAKATRKDLKDVLGVSDTVYERYVIPMRKIWFSK